MSDIIGQMLMAMDPKIRPWDQVVKEGAQADTALIELANLRRQQEAQKLARQYYQQNPEALMGQGSGQQVPTLATLGQPAPGAPMTQQTMRPGQAPGAAQVVPGGQDLSRFATGQPQSTIASLSQPQGPPQAPPQQLMDLVRRNPDAAFAVMQQQQQQQDLALKRDEQRLTMGTKVAEYVGRVAQGVTSPETLEQARQELARIHPQAAAQLPQVYSKEAMLPFISQALSVKDSAQIRLETWKNQIEMQKAGLQGEPAAMVSELRTMGVNPLQATTEQRQQAQKNIQQREVEQKEKEGLASAQARTEGEKQARLDKTVSEAFGERTTKLYDAQTGGTVDSRMKVKDYEALPAGRVKELSANSTEIMENVNNAVPIVAQLQTYMDKIYGPGGILARMTPEDRSLWSSWTNSTAATALGAQFMQKYPELTQAQRFIDSNAGALARAIAGEKGAMAEGDVERAKAMMPNLKTAFTVWPPSALGATLPDTRAVALRTMNSMVDTINARMKTLLGNEQFAHPKLRRYETAEDAQTAAGGTVTAPPVEPPGGPAPTPPPAAGPPIFPRPAIREPGAPAPAVPTAPTTRPTSQVAPAPAPAPATRPAPPTARSTPAQDEAYQQWQQQQQPPAPAPGKQSQAGRPGRRAVELARASGIKMMDAQDIRDAMDATGRSRAEVIKAARARGYTVYSGGTAMA